MINPYDPLLNPYEIAGEMADYLINNPLPDALPPDNLGLWFSDGLGTLPSFSDLGSPTAMNLSWRGDASFCPAEDSDRGPATQHPEVLISIRGVKGLSS